MQESVIELLSEYLVDEHTDIALDVLGYAAKLQSPLGWHYLLDLIWIIKELPVKPPATILDAGAGQGVLQYILALMGYNVISADMRPRNFPKFAHYYFDTSRLISSIRDAHSYGDFLDSKFTRPAPRAVQQGKDPSLFQKVLQTPLGELPGKTNEYLRWCLSQRSQRASQPISQVSKAPEIEQLPSDNRLKNGHGSLCYYSCDLTNMDRIDDNTIDLVVSVSALEHNPPEKTTDCIDELTRVLKPGGSMLLTISATHPESTFHQQSHSWLLNEKDIARTYKLEGNYQSNFLNYSEIWSAFQSPRYLAKWLNVIYLGSDKSGMPRGYWNPQYLPVGIVKRCG